MRENKIKRKILSSSRTLKTLAGKCEVQNYDEINQLTAILKGTLDFEFLERRETMTLFNTDKEILKTSLKYYKCSKI